MDCFIRKEKAKSWLVFVIMITLERSTSGYVFFLSGATISWSSRKQPVVTLSTTKAEFIVAPSCACQGIWLRRVLEEVKYSQQGPIMLFYDNSSAIKLLKNPVLHGRSKHIDTRFHSLPL